MENVCAVCDVMEMRVSDCIRISEKTRHTRFRLCARKTPVYFQFPVFYSELRRFQRMLQAKVYHVHNTSNIYILYTVNTTYRVEMLTENTK